MDLDDHQKGILGMLAMIVAGFALLFLGRALGWWGPTPETQEWMARENWKREKQRMDERLKRQIQEEFRRNPTFPGPR